MTDNFCLFVGALGLQRLVRAGGTEAGPVSEICAKGGTARVVLDGARSPSAGCVPGTPVRLLEGAGHTDRRTGRVMRPQICEHGTDSNR